MTQLAEMIWFPFSEAKYVSECSRLAHRQTCTESSSGWCFRALEYFGANNAACRALRGIPSRYYIEQETLIQTFDNAIVAHEKCIRYLGFINL